MSDFRIIFGQVATLSKKTSMICCGLIRIVLQAYVSVLTFRVSVDGNSGGQLWSIPAHQLGSIFHRCGLGRD